MNNGGERRNTRSVGDRFRRRCQIQLWHFVIGQMYVAASEP